jgi:hypothetical protein
MAKVKMKESRFGPDGSFLDGKEYDVDKKRAETWIKNNVAVSAEPKTKKKIEKRTGR